MVGATTSAKKWSSSSPAVAWPETLRRAGRYQALVAEARLGGERVVLAFPLT